MEKIFLVFISLMFIMCLNGCYVQKDSFFTLNDILLDVNNINDIAVPMECIDLYFISKNNYFDIYECKQKEENKIIAGYNDIKILEGLDELSETTISPLDNNYRISGIDNYLKLYQDALMSGNINEKDNPIEYKYVSVDNLPLIDGNKRLILVLEERSINAENIKTNESIEFKIYNSVEGHISFNVFYINACEPKENSFEHFLFTDINVKKYYIEDVMQFHSLTIYENKYVKEYTNGI